VLEINTVLDLAALEHLEIRRKQVSANRWGKHTILHLRYGTWNVVVYMQQWQA
jgi:hypothetical protein